MKSKSTFLQNNPVRKTPDPIFGNPKIRPFKTNIPDEEYNRRNAQSILGKTFGTSPLKPKQNSESDKYPLTIFKREHMSSANEPESFAHETHRTREVKDIRGKYLKDGSVVSNKNTENLPVDFEKAVTDKGSRQFLERYNHPVTRTRMKEQNKGMTDYDIDNFILHGLTAKKVDPKGMNWKHGAEYNNDKHEIKIQPGHATPNEVETHERVHASRFDNIQGKNLQKILGNAWLQKNTKYFPDVKDYMNKPHEAYGNFAEFREQIKLKPGEKIDVKELERRVKKGGIETQTSNFYKTYDKDKIVEALNTIASNDSTSSSPWTNKHTNT
jgi:hypothetical protein